MDKFSCCLMERRVSFSSADLGLKLTIYAKCGSAFVEISENGRLFSASFQKALDSFRLTDARGVRYEMSDEQRDWLWNYKPVVEAFETSWRDGDEMS